LLGSESNNKLSRYLKSNSLIVNTQDEKYQNNMNK